MAESTQSESTQTEIRTAPQAAMPEAAPEPAPRSTERTTVERGVTMLLFCATVFLSAFLLFEVQPLIGKFILPWFGASPGVWTTCMLFFQIVLLAGYAYAHFVVTKLSVRRQAVTHVCLLGLALLTLPITPAESWKPGATDEPIGRILLILTVSVGAPFALLSSTGPLLQGWFARLHPTRSPYRLFALSNAGSLLALVAYPFVVERALRLREQTTAWSVFFGLFAVLCGACALKLLRAFAATATELPPERASDADATGALPVADVALWIALSACGSGLLLAATNQICLDLAVVPFLWVLPLGLYLLTFILCFGNERWYARPLFGALLAVALINAVRVVQAGPRIPAVEQIAVHASALFVCCMCCHGELARLKPKPERLTFYFLMVAVGGALGGIFVAVVAQFLFGGIREFLILLVACYALILAVGFRAVLRDRDPRASGAPSASRICWFGCAAAVLCGIGLFFDVLLDTTVDATFGLWLAASACLGTMSFAAIFGLVGSARPLPEGEIEPPRASRTRLELLGFGAIASVGLASLTASLGREMFANPIPHVVMDRNFYGVLAVDDHEIGRINQYLTLEHGRIAHGSQFVHFHRWPTTYYGPTSGVGLAIRLHPNRGQASRQFRIGCVGLGIGTIAAYANASVDPASRAYAQPQPKPTPDYVRFYEINPLVRDWADAYFTFLADARTRRADVDVLMGDARIVMERQLERGNAEKFDVLAIDAFRGDAVPIHLLTKESFAIYSRHVDRDGILAIHVTSAFVDLIPILRRIAEEAGVGCVHIRDGQNVQRGIQYSDWVLMTNNRTFLAHPDVASRSIRMPRPGPLWTDDFSSLFEVLK